MRQSPIQDDGRLYRVQLRDHCASSLKAANTLAGRRVYCSTPWPTTADRLPALWLSVPADTASSLGSGPPGMSRTATMQVIGIVMGDDPQQAQQLVDQFNQQVELALLTNHTLIASVEEVAALHTEIELNSEARDHLARFTLSIDLKYSEFWPLSGPSLTELSGRMKGI